MRPLCPVSGVSLSPETADWPSPSTARLSAAGLFSENRKSNELITVELNGVRKRILITVRLGVRLRGTDGTFSVMTDIKLFCSDD